MAIFFLVDFKLIIPKTNPSRAVKSEKKKIGGERKTISKIFEIHNGMFDIRHWLIPRSGNNNGCRANAILVILITPNTKDAIAFPFWSVFLI